MHKHINAFSFFGSMTTMLGYISWMQTLSFVALCVTIVTGGVTLGYTIYKWRKEYKNDQNAK